MIIDSVLTSIWKKIKSLQSNFTHVEVFKNCLSSIAAYFCTGHLLGIPTLLIKQLEDDDIFKALSHTIGIAFYMQDHAPSSIKWRRPVPKCVNRVAHDEGIVLVGCFK